MTLTKDQCDLLINMVNASIQRARDSGIPIGVEYYEDIEIIREKLYEEYRESNRRGEEVNRDFD